MKDPLRHHRQHRQHPDMGTGRMGRVADAIAEGIGTVQFLIVALVLIVAWITVNGGYAYFSGAVTHLEHGRPFDAAPWILLNLIFSFEAFFTGSLVVIAQKASAKRDRAREEADAHHREDIAVAQQAALEQNTQLTEQIHRLLRQNTDLTEQVHQLVDQHKKWGK